MFLVNGFLYALCYCKSSKQAYVCQKGYPPHDVPKSAGRKMGREEKSYFGGLGNGFYNPPQQVLDHSGARARA